MKGATHETGVNKRQRKPNGESRMESPETLATLGIQDTRQSRDTGNIGYTRQRTKTNKQKQKTKTKIKTHNTEN